MADNTESQQPYLDLKRDVAEIANELGPDYQFQWETKVKELVQIEAMEHGRGEYDATHMSPAGDWGKVIGKLSGLDKRNIEILSFVGNIHDIGYSFPKGHRPNQDEIRTQKPNHGHKSYEKARRWAYDGTIQVYFSEEEWGLIDYMCSNHDYLEYIGKIVTKWNENPDFSLEKHIKEKGNKLDAETMLYLAMAIDTIAQIDVGSGVKMSLSNSDLNDYFDVQFKRRLELISTHPTPKFLEIIKENTIKQMTNGGK